MVQQKKKKHTLAILRKELDKSPFGFQIATQKGLAEALGVSRETISQIERGILKLSTKLAGRIELFTGISSSWLLGEDSTVSPVDIDGKPYNAEVRLIIPKYKLVSISEERARLLGNRVEQKMMEFIKDQDKFSIMFHKINKALEIL